MSIDELADLQAGLLTPDEEVVLRERVAADPAAAELWDALEQTRLDLAGLDEEPVPDDVIARIDVALAAEADARADTGGHASAPVTDPAGSQDAPGAGEGSVIDLAAARTRPRPFRSRRRAGSDRSASRRRWLGPGLAVGAAASVVAVVIGVVAGGPGAQRPQAGSAPVAPNITASELAAQWPSITQFHDLGFLAPPGKLEKCVPLPPGEQERLLGARPIVVDGKYGILVAIDNLPVYLKVLGPQCGTSPTSPDSDVIAFTFIPT